MKLFTSCKKSIDYCLKEKRFSIAHLSNEEKTLDMHIHDCFEIYISLSGSKHFFIDDRSYDVEKGNIFAINQYESHYLLHDKGDDNERIVISIYPKYLEQLSSSNTDLCQCFNRRDIIANHKTAADNYQLNYISSLVNKIVVAEGFGADLIEDSTFIELLIYINKLFIEHNKENNVHIKYPNNELIENILEYINKNIKNSVTIEEISRELFISSSYACRVFKNETGTTINKYITARKISLSKSMLANGCSVKEACEGSGFNDYANFIKVFNKVVGTSPKKYGKSNMVKII
ncbi:AraC family transcriptional regulator [Clostridium sp. 19966]|uniref:AraC family transcriptional regulator n=1 Tax=Clostridium sp. 19966 TaxID=2768166 RepID=UPI0028DF6B11|nr:AraC family transcriptional regulator [Clostridium sp. 19966]MDT8715704.1 AraC family transcriptional regulator [Clostridium sp. 19966]